MKITIKTIKGRKHVHLYQVGNSLPSMGVITSERVPSLAILAWVKQKIREV